LKPFKKGAFWSAVKHDVPIVPIATYGGLERRPKGSFTVIPGDVYLHIAPPIYPMDIAGGLSDKVQTLMDVARDTIDGHVRSLMRRYGK